MFEGLFMLLSLSTLMAIASFLAGSLPLSFSLSQSQLRLVSTIGMGVLVGTSLIVIIPEGIETLYTAYDVGHVHARSNIQLRALELRWDTGATGAHAPIGTARENEIEDEIDAIKAPPGPVIPEDLDISTGLSSSNPPKTPTEEGIVHALGDEEPTDSGDSKKMPKHSQAEEDEHRTPHAWVGISLVLGFILMYLIDTLPSLKPPPPPRGNNIYSLSDLSAASSLSQSDSTPSTSFSTTLGLVIHSAADGIALGASSTQPNLSFVIFFAIMVHKAPAAFGLVSVLLKQGLSKRQARAHLLAFSFAAPAGALLTWLVVRILGGGGGTVSGAVSMKWWTGVILLFSGGTFLYVAMHTMQEDDGAVINESHTNGNGYLDREPTRQKQQKSLKLIMAAVLGMLLPLLTQIGHAH